MASRVQGQTHAADVDRVAVTQSVQRDVLAEPRAHHTLRCRVGEIVRVSAARVVGVSMGYNGPGYRKPGVNVEVARRTVQPTRARDDQIALRADHTRRSPSMPPSLDLLPVKAAKLILTNETSLPALLCQ